MTRARKVVGKRMRRWLDSGSVLADVLCPGDTTRAASRGIVRRLPRSYLRTLAFLYGGRVIPWPEAT